jgi:hypothetical protein
MFMPTPRKKVSQSRKPSQPKRAKKQPALTEEEREMIAFVANSMAIEGFNCDEKRLIREARKQGLIGS